LCRLMREKLGVGGGSGNGADVGATSVATSQSSRDGGQVATDVAPTAKGDSVPGSSRCDFRPDIDTSLKEPRATVLIPGNRVRYLAEIAEQGRSINDRIESQSEIADRAQSYWQSLHDLEDPQLPKQLDLYATDDLHGPSTPNPRAPSAVGAASAANAQNVGDDVQVAAEAAPTTERGSAPAVDRTLLTLRQRYNDAVQSLDSEALKLLRDWPARLKSITDEVNEYQVRD